MLIEESRKRQGKLEKIIYEMAILPLENNELRLKAIKLKSLYNGNFRHSYSRFYPLILEIAKDENKYNLDFLSENLENIRVLVEKDYFNGENEFKGLYNPLSKLSDHLNLEIARYNHYMASESVTRDLLQKNKDLEMILEQTQKSLDETKKKAANIQTEYTTILGIFAAIILAFTGTITFSSSVLDNIHQVSIYRLIIIALILGFVAFNIISILIDFIVGINKIELKLNNNKTSFFNKNWKVIIFNIVVIIGIVVTCFAYKGNWFEKQINPEKSDIIIEQHSTVENPAS